LIEEGEKAMIHLKHKPLTCTGCGEKIGYRAPYFPGPRCETCGGAVEASYGDTAPPFFRREPSMEEFPPEPRGDFAWPRWIQKLFPFFFD